MLKGKSLLICFTFLCLDTLSFIQPPYLNHGATSNLKLFVINGDDNVAAGVIPEFDKVPPRADRKQRGQRSNQPKKYSMS